MKRYENFWIGNANVSSKDCIAIKSRDDYTQDKDHPDQNFFYVCELGTVRSYCDDDFFPGNIDPISVFKMNVLARV